MSPDKLRAFDNYGMHKTLAEKSAWNTRMYIKPVQGVKHNPTLFAGCFLSQHDWCGCISYALVQLRSDAKF